ncbi:BOLA class I histocompatibility antigen, alpha chain BL3-6-like isoform X2 [Denticeps clupeoides]|uniref:BOLA class I histocompatibility antigen, alpha chain BL3-6-like isoform X2 n=1 Tax=Denticeps clupeoides TaxID=299321 RepID=UPI0010A41048|nr:BOLA class I histocompatibility antigen, alpha chain BL3-6-like isoform X2 [Denticeps clupeoides]
MKILVILICSLLVLKIDLASGGSHSLQYFYTGVTQGFNFPEFTAVGMMDGQQFLYYDSNIRQAIPKVDWIKNNEGPDYWTRETQNLQGHEAKFKVNIGKLMQHFIQSDGIHTFQKMCCCEWDDETGATDGYEQYGYDGADFISLDLKSTSWVASVKEALITKQKWDGAAAEWEKNYLTQTCIDWLKKYVQYGNISLKRKVPPQVSLLQTDPSSPVVCHATGFYPDKVKISWQKDRKELHEDVDVGETLPNHDGTFQKRAKLNIAPDVWKKNQFTCVVEHKSGDPIHMILTEEKIRTNYRPGAVVAIPGIVAGLMVAALVVIAVVVGVVKVVKRRSGYKKASQLSRCTNHSLPSTQEVTPTVPNADEKAAPATNETLLPDPEPPDIAHLEHSLPVSLSPSHASFLVTDTHFTMAITSLLL